MHPKLVAAGIAALVLSSAAACSSSGDSKGSSSATTTSKVAANSGRVTDLKLDSGHDYGNKYANGILPVGDGKFVTDAAKKGSVYLCRAPQGQAGGAGSRGPWFINNNTEYDINKKIAVDGNVNWDASYSETMSGGSRVITTNDLPRDHTTGVFPVQPSDPAYQYDRNPNQIAAQSLTYTLSASSNRSPPASVGRSA